MTPDKTPSALDWKNKAVEHRRKETKEGVLLMATNALLESENTALSTSSAPQNLPELRGYSSPVHPQAHGD